MITHIKDVVRRAPNPAKSAVETSERAPRSRRTLVGVAGALLVGLPAILLGGSGASATPLPAHLNNTVGLKTVGPIDESNGFPLWYKDTSGQRLELCLDPNDPMCIMAVMSIPQMSAMTSFNSSSLRRSRRCCTGVLSHFRR